MAVMPIHMTRDHPRFGALLCQCLVVSLLSLLLPGCASSGKQVTQTLMVETPGCTAVSCDLSNDRGAWQVPRTPGSVAVITSNVLLKVSCRDEAGALGQNLSHALMADTQHAGAAVGGLAGGAAVGVGLGSAALAFIPVLGVLAVGTGLAMGAVAGSVVDTQARELHYPQRITVVMRCAVVDKTPAATVDFGIALRGMPLAEALAAGLGERSAVLMTRVNDGGSAAAAELRAGDIVLSAGGAMVADAADFEQIVRAMPSGTSLTLLCRREGQTFALVLTRPAVVP